MPCKSLRFVVSPLTAPVEHDRRRCTGRNTIISAVNKFLGLLSRRNRVVRQISRYCFLAVFQILTASSNFPREKDLLLPVIFVDQSREKAIVYIPPIDCNFLAPVARDWRFFRRVSHLYTCRNSIKDSLTFQRIEGWITIVSLVLCARKNGANKNDLKRDEK